MKCPPITGRADDRPKSVLENAVEGNFTLAKSVVIPIADIVVFATKLDQLPHQPVGFSNGQLIPGHNRRIDSIVTVIMDTGGNALVSIVGNVDVQISFLHVHFLPFCSSWNILSIAENYKIVKRYI